MKKLNMNKETMKWETKNFLQTLFSLDEVERVAIKDITILSLEDDENIQKGLEECYHDNMSDVDVNVWIAIHPSDYNEVSPIYKKYLDRLRISDRIFGIVFQGRDANNKEGLRICLDSGFRMDLSCHVRCDESAKVLPSAEVFHAEVPVNSEKFPVFCDVNKVDEFWFIAIQALAKLLRRDYLIADHLVHMLLMEGLVVQMINRDHEYQTNFHRYGYAEELTYRNVELIGHEKYYSSSEDTYNYIAQNLIKAVLSFEELVVKSVSRYERRVELFFSIWDCYLN